MELISILTARVLWFVELRDINPRGIALRYTLLPALAERYRFAVYPYDTPDNHPTEKESGFRFREGEFTNSAGVSIMVSLVIHDDGLVADTRSSTRDGEEFLSDVVQWAVKEFGLVFKPSMVTRKGYVSEVNIAPSAPLINLHEGLNEIGRSLSEMVSQPSYLVTYDCAGIFWSVDPVVDFKPAGFRFERRLDAPFGVNRYYTQAPLQTDQHLELLQKFESLLTAKP